jgi:hypothetical protein
MYNEDMAVMSILLNRLQYLRDNPDELAMIFDYYRTQWSYFSAIGCKPDQYINQILDIFDKNGYPLVNVFEGYSHQSAPNFALFVYSSSQEAERSMGDYGTTEFEILTPTVYASNVRVHHIVNHEDASILYIARSCNVLDKIWRLQRVYNKYLPNESWQVVSVADDGDQYIRVELDSVVGTVNGMQPLQQWGFRAYESGYSVTYGMSIDSCSVRLILRSTGDIEFHKLLRMIVRYCLKSGRQLFEFQNCQMMTMGMGEPQPVQTPDDVAVGFITAFSLSFKSVDTWILKKTKLPEYMAINVQMYEDEDGESTFVTEIV